METSMPEVFRVLESFPIFQDLPWRDRANLGRYLLFCAWPGGEVIFEEGEHSHFLLFLSEGEVSVQQRDKSRRIQELAVVSGHATLGESAFIGNEPRSTTAVAKTSVVGLILTRERYDELCRQDPPLANLFLRKMNRLLALKLRKASKEYAELKPD